MKNLWHGPVGQRSGRASYHVHLTRSTGDMQAVTAELRKTWWSKTALQTRSRTVAVAVVPLSGGDETVLVATVLRELAAASEDDLYRL